MICVGGCWWLRLMKEHCSGITSCAFMIFSAKEVKYIHPFNQTRGCLFQLPRRPLFIIFQQREPLFFAILPWSNSLGFQAHRVFFVTTHQQEHIVLCQLQKCFQLLIKINQIKIPSQQCITSNVGEAKATHTIQKYVCNNLQHNQSYCSCHYCYS